MTPTRPEPGAILDHACVLSPDPERAAAFLARACAMARKPIPGGWECTGPHRTLLVREGPANRIAFFAYAFDSAERLEAHRRKASAAGARALPNPSPRFDASACAFEDPDGNVVAFGLLPKAAPAPEEPLPARLQHLALRTPRLDDMASFYESLGFVVSDRVRDDAGALRACFLRTDAEHHALALFGAAEARFDHLSCETRDSAAVIAWPTAWLPRASRSTGASGGTARATMSSSWCRIRTGTSSRSRRTSRCATHRARRARGGTSSAR